MRWVATFAARQSSARITNDSELTLLLLIQDGTEPGGAGIGVEYIGLLGICKTQRRCGGKFVNDRLECLLASRGPSFSKELLWVTVLI